MSTTYFLKSSFRQNVCRNIVSVLPTVYFCRQSPIQHLVLSRQDWKKDRIKAWLFSYFSINICLHLESDSSPTSTTPLWTSNRHFSSSYWWLSHLHTFSEEIRGFNSTCTCCLIFHAQKNWKNQFGPALSAVQSQYAPLDLSIISFVFFFSFFFFLCCCSCYNSSKRKQH